MEKFVRLFCILASSSTLIGVVSILHPTHGPTLGLLTFLSAYFALVALSPWNDQVGK